MTILTKRWFLIGVALLGLLVILVVAAYGYIFGFGSLMRAANQQPGSSNPPELMVTEIALDGPISNSQAELSGLAWYGDTLILLPQYPSRFGEGEGAIFALDKKEILAYLDGETSDPLEPRQVPLISGGIDEEIRGFEGFEAVAFSGEQAYLTVEARNGIAMIGYLVRGEIATDLSVFRLESETISEIPTPVQIGNKSDEEIFLTNDHIYTLFEVNGEDFNTTPLAHCFTLDMEPCQEIPFPNLEYRLTDASALDQQGRFWVINYQFPGDINIRPKRDPLAEQYGQGASHSVSNIVERLVEFQYDNGRITRSDRPPLQLQLISEARNWEGLVRLDSLGFLMVTDKFPGTILGFVEIPGE